MLSNELSPMQVYETLRNYIISYTSINKLQYFIYLVSIISICSCYLLYNKLQETRAYFPKKKGRRLTEGFRPRDVLTEGVLMEGVLTGGGFHRLSTHGDRLHSSGID